MLIRKLITCAFTLLMLSTTQANASPVHADTRAMGVCLAEAANTIVKLNPSYRLEQIAVPAFDRTFDDKDEVGRPMKVARYNGRAEIVFADRKGAQVFSCTFWQTNDGSWAFSWTGLGPTHVEGFGEQ